MSRTESGEKSRSAEESSRQTDAPRRYRVMMHNDDYTSMEFVVAVLETVFHKSPTEANQIMLNIHFKGAGLCGIFPFEIAETKVAKVTALAAAEGFPLRCSIEEA